MSFYDFKERSQNVVEKYLLDRINYGIRKESRKFTKENIPLFLEKIGWNFQALFEYVSQDSKYENITGIKLLIVLILRLYQQIYPANS